MYERIASLIVVLIYAIFACRSDGAGGFIYTILLSVIPLSLIWFGDWLGQCTGYIGRGGTIDQTSPGCLVKLMGWIFLAVPLIIHWLMASVGIK